MTGSIAAIDWHNHDGVNLSMINDFTRNLFYDRIIRDNVQGQPVLDIGFGTGLLSMLALKYGATSVVAYESDDNRYALGKDIIQQLGLGHQIQLINQRFDWRLYENYPDYVVVTETVNGNLWQEGLLNSLPRKPGCRFLPGEYFLNIYAVEIPNAFAQGLGQPAVEPRGFVPALDLDPEFVTTVNRYFNSEYVSVAPRTLEQLELIDPHIDTNWGWLPMSRCIDHCHLAASYTVNAHSLTVLNGQIAPFDFGANALQLTMNVDSRGSTLLVPRVGMRHNDQVLFLDRGHWGPTLVPAIVTNFQGSVHVTHNLHNGDISYSLDPAKNQDKYTSHVY